MFGYLKIGVAVGVGYAVGGWVGVHTLRAVKADASADMVTAAAWGGRAAAILLGLAISARI